jgi:hypothetical protein
MARPVLDMEDRMRIKKQIRQELAALGITRGDIAPTRGGHIKVTIGEVIIFTSKTPSDHRSVRNMVAQVRRAGRQA